MIFVKLFISFKLIGTIDSLVRNSSSIRKRKKQGRLKDYSNYLGCFLLSKIFIVIPNRNDVFDLSL